jgi:hypothetical protein
MVKGAREDGNERRRQITLHSLRRFVKTPISDLGYADYSEYFIGSCYPFSILELVENKSANRLR